MKLRARDIRLHLGRSEILHGVDLTARAGQLTAIIGPNGSGKTSLLRALTGEIVPTSGDVTLHGRDVSAMRTEELASTRAVLPQQSALSFPFTVAEIVRIGLSAIQVGQNSDGDDLIRAALNRVGLPGHSGRLYQELSGGEQQRVQLARTLVQIWHPVGPDGPCWLLLDEPVSSLDIAQQLTVMRLAADYARQGGGVVAIMHDLNLTAMFADHVLLIQEGRAVAEGPPAEVMTNHMLSGAYGCSLQVNHTPSNGVWLLPQGAAL